MQIDEVEQPFRGPMVAVITHLNDDLSGTIAAAAQPPKPVLVDVQRIWDMAPHNAFTGLIRFKGRRHCVFGEGTELLLHRQFATTVYRVGMEKARRADLRPAHDPVSRRSLHCSGPPVRFARAQIALLARPGKWER